MTTYPPRGNRNNEQLGLIVLAAGESRRMGTINKLLLPIGPLTLLEHALAAYTELPARQKLVVLGEESAILEPIVQRAGFASVINHAYHQGQMSSVAAGLAALDDQVDRVMIALADQPLLTTDDVKRIIDPASQAADDVIVVPVHQNRPGNPRVFTGRHVAALKRSGAAVDCRAWIAANTDNLVKLVMGTDGVVVDIDTPEEYSRVLQRMELAS